MPLRGLLGMENSWLKISDIFECTNSIQIGFEISLIFTLFGADTKNDSWSLQDKMIKSEIKKRKQSWKTADGKLKVKLSQNFFYI